jgi:phosphatidate cytidylyltransferase
VLKQRVLTSISLIPPILGGILFSPNWLVAIGFGVVMGLGAWEWGFLAGWVKDQERRLYVLFLLLILAALYWFFPPPWEYQAIVGYSIISLSLWGIFIYWLTDYEWGGLGMPPLEALPHIVGFLVLVPTWIALVILHGSSEHGPYLLLVLLLLVWTADIAAFFVGRRWGHRKLAARLSPGKTWEGVAGGLIGSMVVAGLASLPIPMSLSERGLFLGICLVAVAFSILGDLFESLLKRRAGVKDSGALIPGHGGMLDRIDSLTAAAPIFVIGVLWFGIGQ